MSKEGAEVEKVVILPADSINTDPPAMTRQKPRDMVLHLMGEHSAFRVKVFSSGFREICNFLSQHATPFGNVQMCVSFVCN
jgi:hypothetical protein